SKAILACAGGMLRCWDRATGRERWQLGGGRVGRVLALSPDRQRVAVCTESGSLRLLDAATGKEVATVGEEGLWHRVVAASPGGGLLASTYRGTDGRDAHYVWDVRTGRRLHQLPFDYAGIYTIAFSPDGRVLAYGGSGNAVYLLDPRTGKER